MIFKDYWFILYEFYQILYFLSPDGIYTIFILNPLLKFDYLCCIMVLFYLEMFPCIFNLRPDGIHINNSQFYLLIVEDNRKREGKRHHQPYHLHSHRSHNPTDDYNARSRSQQTLIPINHHFQAAVQLLQGLSLNLSEAKYSFKLGNPHTLRQYSSNFGKPFNSPPSSRVRVCSRSASVKSNHVRSPPAMKSLFPRRPVSFLKNYWILYESSLRDYQKVMVLLQLPQTSLMYPGQKSLQSPWAAAMATSSSAFLPISYGFSALQQRCRAMASHSEITLSPSMRQGKVTAAFFSRSVGLTSSNHFFLPSFPAYLTSVQGMQRCQRRCLMRSANPRASQQPRVTVACSIQDILIGQLQHGSYFYQYLAEFYSFIYDAASKDISILRVFDRVRMVSYSAIVGIQPFACTFHKLVQCFRFKLLKNSMIY